ncbi:DUF6416 domain-containing protein [Nocardia terrae]|uniref:DUF6416 domain-containing protein n=1 Tax=Nocardia terrae TaxID=2675851 RepID=UPI0038B2EF0F
MNIATQPWTPSDADLAAEVWDRLSDKARALLSVLVDAPGREFSGQELAELLGLSGSQSAAGILSRPSRLCAEAGRGYMWRWRYPDGQPCVYSMDEDIAALFRGARG